MYQHILIATDGSELATKAVELGAEFSQALKAKVTIVTITRPFPMPSYGRMPADTLVSAHEKASAENAAQILAAAREVALRNAIACEMLRVTEDDIAGAIVSTAQSKGCDLIVMGSHGYRGIARLLLGSVATKVLTLSAMPVLICR